jgi:phosphoribosylglycinamide formyltransferase-1
MLSGGGRTLANLLEHTRSGSLAAEIALVIASRECPGAARAREAGIRTLIMPGVIPAQALERTLLEHRIDWVILAGYLQLVQVPASFRGRIVNIHPALLPDFGGPGMYGPRVHRAVLDAGRAESGCTVHLVDEAYDRGPIVLQLRCPILPGDTPQSLADRIFELERAAYPAALARLLAATPPPRR